MIADGSIEKRLRAFGELADGEIDLAEAALTLARAARPHVSEAPYRRHIESLIEEVGVYAGTPPNSLELRVESLRRVIFRRYGYGGDEGVFDDLDSANLMFVIDRRRGLPVVIGLLVIHVARRLGWNADGIDFPGRFLARLEDGPRRMIVDPFEDLAEMSPFALRVLLKTVSGNDAELTPAMFEPMENRAILARIQNNLKVRLLRARRVEDALPVIENMILLDPTNAGLHRESGLIHARLGLIDQAIEKLESYIRLSPSESGRYRVSILIRDLRAGRNET